MSKDSIVHLDRNGVCVVYPEGKFVKEQSGKIFSIKMPSVDVWQNEPDGLIYTENSSCNIGWKSPGRMVKQGWQFDNLSEEHKFTSSILEAATPMVNWTSDYPKAMSIPVFRLGRWDDRIRIDAREFVSACSKTIEDFCGVVPVFYTLDGLSRYFHRANFPVEFLDVMPDCLIHPSNHESISYFAVYLNPDDAIIKGQILDELLRAAKRI